MIMYFTVSPPRRHPVAPFTRDVGAAAALRTSGHDRGKLECREHGRVLEHHGACDPRWRHREHLQGMPVLGAVTSRIAAVGDKLIGGTTDVFAHASVALATEPAAACMRELRRRIRSPATAYKANPLLREKHRPVLVWLLGPAGPIRGHARVYLMDKALFVLGRVTGLLLDDPGAAVGLYRAGPGAFGPARWEEFLVACNNLMRLKEVAPVDAFFRVVDALRGAGPVGHLLDRLALGGPRAVAFRARLEDPSTVPGLDPLIPAIVSAVRYWGADGRPVSIVHDQQNTLSEERIVQLKEAV